MGPIVTMNCLFVSLPAIGHLKSLIAIAKVLASQGHCCYFLSSHDMEFYFRQTDLIVLYSQTHDVQMKRNSPKRKPYRKQITDFNYLTKAVEKEIKLIQYLKIDLLFVDAFISVPISANIANIPWISHLLGPTWLEGGTPFFANADTTEESEQLLRVIEYFNVLNVSHEWPSILYSPYLNLVSGIKQFVSEDNYGIKKNKAHIVFIGGICCGENISPFKEVEISKPVQFMSPSAFASLGTLNGDVSLYRLICRALKKSSLAKTIIATGLVSPQALRESFSSSSEMVFKRFVPSEKILPHVEVAIIHGGYNSVLECIYHGVPMLIVPANRGSDQIANGLMVESLEVGLMADWPYKICDISRKIEILLKDSKYKRACQNIKKLLHSVDGKKIVRDKIDEIMKHNGG